MPRQPDYVIFAPRYEGDNGGAIALYALCTKLRALGANAAIHRWPARAYIEFAGASWLNFAKKEVIGRLRPQPLPFDVAFSDCIGPDTIVIYPELVRGNPLKAQRVVRWILYKSSEESLRASAAAGELVTYYDRAFLPQPEALPADRLLRLSWINPAYRQTNFGERVGACYMVRKGAGRDLNYHPTGARQVDGMAHEELAIEFNRCAFFYTYDLHTFYSVYAVLCGCTPIVVPQEGLSRERWAAGSDFTLGVAYGEEDIDRARAAKPDLLRALADRERFEDQLVHGFIEVCNREFARRDEHAVA